MILELWQEFRKMVEYEKIKEIFPRLDSPLIRDISSKEFRDKLLTKIDLRIEQIEDEISEFKAEERKSDYEYKEQLKEDFGGVK